MIACTRAISLFVAAVCLMGAEPASVAADSARTDIPERALDGAAQRASVVVAARTGQHPERLSPGLAPAPFDKESYRRNPSAYLDVVEPGRAWMAAEAGPDVPELICANDYARSLAVGERTTLVFTTAPRAPVTVTTTDLGVFPENGLTSITVQADARGRATVVVEIPAGTHADVRLAAASPLASGVVELRLSVREPVVAASESAP